MQADRENPVEGEKLMEVRERGKRKKEADVVGDHGQSLLIALVSSSEFFYFLYQSAFGKK